MGQKRKCEVWASYEVKNFPLFFRFYTPPILDLAGRKGYPNLKGS